MRLTRQSGILKLESEAYNLTFLDDRPFVTLKTPAGEPVAELFVLSAVQPMQGRDETPACGEWQADEREGEIVLSLTAESAYWERKVYRFCCYPHRFSYNIEVYGEGDLAEVIYFGGAYSGALRWGSGFHWSGQSFRRGFNPEPNTDEVYSFSPQESTGIDMMGVPLPGRGNWFFTPPPFCLAFEVNGGWVGIGVEAQAGENRFTEYAYHARRGAFCMSLSYDGQTHVKGSCRLPAIGFDFAADEFQALDQHVRSLRAQGLVPTPSGWIKPVWWREPIFCGWGAQCALAAAEGGKAQDYSRQERYEAFLNTLEESSICPGVVVLDDKWQKHYGTNQVDPSKWPDLPGFIRRRHAAGGHVLLWLKAWDPEGLPVEECVTNRAGRLVSFDPTSPAFEARLRAAVRQMISPDGYGADGFKVDFTARIPAGPGLRIAGSAWGLELMRRYLEILAAEARQIKPDALIMTHTPNPYLADVTDMIRLNDINCGVDVNQAMTIRARIARIACPEAVIDTDNWPIANRADWRRYLMLQPELGVPSLYFTDSLDASREPLEAEDYTLIREVWQRHRSGLNLHDFTETKGWRS
jgi:hypothetical protein